MIMAVDLAAKFSAAMVVDGEEIVEQFDSWNLSEHDFIEKIVTPFRSSHPPIVLVLEDLPHKLPFMSLVKHVCRLQGRILERMNSVESIDKVLFLPPATWQRHYGVFKKGAKGASDLALEMGYTPPYDFNDFKGKDRQSARKVNSDYCDAFLIANWAKEMYNEHGTYDIKTTSRYEG